MSVLVERLAEMARLYRGYDAQLAEWLTTLNAAEPDAATPESWLAHLSRLEEVFISRVRVLGEGVDRERARLSGLAGRELTIREAARRPGAGENGERVCDETTSAVAEVARRRVEALRRLETFCEAIRGERGKIAAARKLGKVYYPGRDQGRRVDGRV